MAINQSTLLYKSSNYRQSIDESAILSKAATKKKTAFLCHSHNDLQLVKGLIVLFKEAGVELYIDWQDTSMPNSPNATTAKKIQLKIRESDLFIFLATENSKNSRWCPWEIGFADSSAKKIYIIPTHDTNNYYGNEYLELYPRIDEGSSETKSGLALFKPGNDKGSWLSTSIL